jgi:hypothetical protein
MPGANLLILIIILVRDQEVGGSNPLAPTNLFDYLNTQLGFVFAFLTATGEKISSILPI